MPSGRIIVSLDQLASPSRSTPASMIGNGVRDDRQHCRRDRSRSMGEGRATLRYAAIALTIVLFLVSIRRSGERVGRLAERLETREKTNHVQRRMLEAAARRPRDRGELVDRLRDGGF